MSENIKPSRELLDQCVSFLIDLVDDRKLCWDESCEATTIIWAIKDNSYLPEHSLSYLDKYLDHWILKSYPLINDWIKAEKKKIANLPKDENGNILDENGEILYYNFNKTQE